MREPMSVDELVAHGESRRGSKAVRLASWGLAAVLVLASNGALHSASVVQGVDPLDILDFQQVPNVLFVVDTSSTMGGTASDPDYWVGGDDSQSRLYRTKVAIRNVIDTNKGRANFGVGQFGPGNDRKVITKKAAWGPDYNRGPFIYVSIDGFNEVKDVGSDANTTTIGDAFARIFQPPTSPSSSAVKYEDYDGLDDATGTACPNTCAYNSGTGVTDCPAYCEQEFLRSIIAVENGFGTSQAAPPSLPFASANPLLAPVMPPAPPDVPTDDKKKKKKKGDGGGDGDTATGRYYIKSRIFRDNVLYRWAPGPGGGATTSPFTQTYGIPISKALSRGLKEILPLPGKDGTGVAQPVCPPPPPGLLSDDVEDGNDGIESRPCFQIELMVGNILKVTKKKRMTFYLASAAFGLEDPDEGCLRGEVNDPVQACGNTSADDQKLLTTGSLRLELPYADPVAGGVPTGLTATGPNFPATNLLGTNPNPQGGIQLGGDGYSAGDNTPIAATLQEVLTYFNTDVFPSRPPTAAGRQKNIVILITDGDENCDTQADAVAAAQALYDNAPTPDNRIETVVVVFPTGAADTIRANAIAAAGSGGTRAAFQGGTLQDDLTEAVNAAIAQANSGGFSAADTTVTESVFEFVDPMKPTKRYDITYPLLFQPTFTMPGFLGHFRAFWNDPDDGLEVAVPRWDGTNDAGEKLLARVTIPAAGAAFPALHGGATPTTIGISSALVKRRILTTVRNGVFVPRAGGKFFDVDAIMDRTAQPDVVSLWPPDTTSTPEVDPTPAAKNVIGKLDGELGLPTSTTYDATTFANLGTEFGACTGSPLPAAHLCNSATNDVKMAQAIKEARQTILAYIAGAQLKGGTGSPERDLLGGLLYERRSWILAESTLSAPAIVTPPLQSDPKVHLDEYVLFRNGPRNAGTAVNGISQGFGLRNPDDDGDPTSAADESLKPQMSVVLLGTNEVLHAFRAGPCLCTGGETGGEELWAFVPFDQLGKLRERLLPQGRNPHTYVLASALRYGDIFVPDSAATGFTKSIGGVTVKGAGVWRTILVFGRGIAGNSYTALDITAPGPFTQESLGTNLPLVYWSRGNPDTNDGTTGGTKNNDSTSGSESDFDYQAYARMGETWSTPALAFVDPNDTKTKISTLGDASCKISKTTISNSRRPDGVEFVFYVGSGYPGTNTLEGTVFYGLDALTGDVVLASDVCDRSSKPTTVTGTVIENALVASPAVFNSAQLVPSDIGHSASTEATRVYIGDLHGRLWKFNTSNTGVPVLVKDLTDGLKLGEQPVANGVALLNYSSDTGTLSPHVYVEAGNDPRFAVDAAKPFKMFGFRDPGVDRNDKTPGEQLFAIDFPVDTTATPVNGFRGTAQPATAYDSRDADANGRVFFLGTKFNPAGTNCVSTFDSILFAVGAGSGLAAYDFGQSFLLQGEKAIAVRVDRGQLVIDQGLSADRLPQAPKPPEARPSGTGTGSAFVSNIRFASPVCRD